MLIMLGELKIPVQFSSVGVESKQRVAVKVVASASFAAIGWRRISGRPQELIGLRIVHTRVPGRRATNFPRIAFPSIVTRLAGSGDGVEPPLPLPSVCIVSIDEAADAVFATGDTKNHEIPYG